MMRVSYTQLLALLAEEEGWHLADKPTRDLLGIVFAGSAADEKTFDPELAGKTLTFEAREVTIVLDFDERGYLASVEFV